MSELNIHTRSTCHASRAAFTLVEMMVVIVIIGILSALTAVGVSKVIGNQRVSNTEGAIRTIQKTLSEHWAAVVNDAKKETGLSGPFQVMDNLFGPDTTGGERNRIIWIKMRLMEAFPVSFSDIINGPFPYRAGIIPLNLQKYTKTYQAALRNPGAGHKAITESSACLLMALSVTRNGTSLNSDNMGSLNVADSDGDGIPEFVDSWGNPLCFYRFPTNNPLLQYSNPATTSVLDLASNKESNPNSINDRDTDPGKSNYAATSPYADPLDPAGVLFNWPAGGASKRIVFENNVHRIAYNKNFACYIVPTIVSWGPDGDLNKKDTFGNPYGLGLDDNIPKQAMAITDFKDPNSDYKHQEADNIYSFKLR